MKGNKRKNKLFFKNLKNKKDNFGAHAVPIIIINNKKQIALIMQDNAPVWRVFGNGFNNNSASRYNRKGKFYTHAQRILKEETNIPISLRSKIKPILRYDLLANDTNLRVESNRVFVLYIGTFQLESKKGAYISFFNAGQRPANMNSYHGKLLNLALHQIIYGDGKELYTAVSVPTITQGTPSMVVLDEMINIGSPIIGIEQWREHPRVTKKRTAGHLLRDP